MENLSTLYHYNEPVSSSGLRHDRGSMELFEDQLQGPGPGAKALLAMPATTSELVALAPCVHLRPEDVLILVVIDGRTKVSDTIYGESGSGCPLVPADKKRMETALANMPVAVDARPDSSLVRDLHLFEGIFRQWILHWGMQ